MEPDDLQCSRNARPQKALVGRAQWKINQPPSLKRIRASLLGPLLSQAPASPAILPCREGRIEQVGWSVYMFNAHTMGPTQAARKPLIRGGREIRASLEGAS